MASLQSASLDFVHRDIVCTIFQDCVDQLGILGGIIPNYAAKPSALDNAMGEELKRILEGQSELEQQFNKLTQDGPGPSGQQLKDQAHAVSVSSQVAKNARSLQENLQKLQRERQELQDLMNGTISEVTAQGTFSTLSAWITRSHEEKLNMERTILKEERSRRHIRQLKRRIIDLKKEKEEEVMFLDEQIAHLKDSIQELKAKNTLEAKHVRKECQVSIGVSQRKTTYKEDDLAEEEKRLRKQLAEETLVSQRIDLYLVKHYEDLAGKVDYWMTKHEQDLDMKSRDLHDLKQNKASDLMKTEDLTQTYKNYEEVVVEHRAMKEKQRIKEEQERRENQIATKIQAWWRGVMVRKGLGPYSKKKKKGKKGKKGKGKKGKKGKKKKK